MHRDCLQGFSITITSPTFISLQLCGSLFMIKWQCFASVRQAKHDEATLLVKCHEKLMLNFKNVTHASYKIMSNLSYYVSLCEKV